MCDIFFKNAILFKITGAPANVAAAKEGIQQRCKELEAEQADRALRSFEVKVISTTFPSMTIFIITTYIKLIGRS